jgi:branched-chain amino acid transport system permease protein
MGIDIFKHKLLSLLLARFRRHSWCAYGIPDNFDRPDHVSFHIYFPNPLDSSSGGNGSLSGSVISAVIITILMEVLRFVEQL